jgi:60 kDa SS-A/Ro ribonucleoprotein
VNDGALLERVFGRLVDTPRMLRNFVPTLCSGVVGGKSLGTRPKRPVERRLERASNAVFKLVAAFAEGRMATGR